MFSYSTHSVSDSSLLSAVSDSEEWSALISVCCRMWSDWTTRGARDNNNQADDDEGQGPSSMRERFGYDRVLLGEAV